MTNFLKSYYGPTEGPLGFPMLDPQARALEALLRTMPRDDAHRYRKAVVEKVPTELSPGERSDVSWISTEAPDRLGDVVLARGMNDSQFRQNPIVTLNHAYWAPPVGKSLWRKFARDGALKGIKAKTQYPARPADWPEAKDWPADLAFALVQADILRGKSIGFLPTRVHIPDSKEIDHNGWQGLGVQLVIDDWLLLEYACTFLPVQQEAVVEAVSKGIALPTDFLKALGVEPPPVPALPEVVPHVALTEIERAVARALGRLDPHALAEQTLQARLDQFRGRV
jgi:hypothetical protein